MESLHKAIAFSLPPLRISTNSLWSPATLSHIFLIALAHPVACGLGFQIILLPHTEAKQKFQANTAIGKLKAVIQPTTPSGCHNSCNLWSGLSLGIVKP